MVMPAMATAFIGMPITRTGPFDSASSIGIQVYDGNGLPLVNASIQGIMYKPPDIGPGGKAR